MLRNFYVDDCLKSVSTEEEAVVLVKNLRNLCKEGGFTLTKWVSNSREVLSSIPTEYRANELKDVDLTRDILPTERALVYSGAQKMIHLHTVSSYRIR